MTITKSKLVLEAELENERNLRGQLEESCQHQDMLIETLEAQVEMASNEALIWRIIGIIYSIVLVSLLFI